MKETKQVIVIRKDLGMSAGKLSAQVSHASLASFFKSTERSLRDGGDLASLNIYRDTACDEWINGIFTKVIVYVKSEEALKNVYKKALDKGLPCALIEDIGKTEFNEPTNTCVGIGPCYLDEFNGVTNKLRLYNAEILSK